MIFVIKRSIIQDNVSLIWCKVNEDILKLWTTSFFIKKWIFTYNRSIWAFSFAQHLKLKFLRILTKFRVPGSINSSKITIFVFYKFQEKAWKQKKWGQIFFASIEIINSHCPINQLWKYQEVVIICTIRVSRVTFPPDY